jgi:hypothetical protein
MRFGFSKRKWIAKAHVDKLVTLTQNKTCNVRVLSCHGVFHLHDMESNIILSFDDYKDQEFELDTSNCTYCGKLCINPFLRKKKKVTSHKERDFMVVFE